MKTILIIFGTRPEAIKMAPIIKEFEKHPDKFDLKVCVTGQHRELLDQVLQLFQIKPHYDLNVMAPNQSLFQITTKILNGLEDVIQHCNPNLILVHGDTTTSMVAAIASFYKQIPVGHIESGLRTNNKYSPWPEEINRQITGRIASYHFCPTELNKRNLLDENILDNTIFVTGNTVIDALLMVVEKLKNDSSLLSAVINTLKIHGINNKDTEAWRIGKRKLILITGHRRESFGHGFINICEAIKELSFQNKDVDFVYPVHLNPHVRCAIKQVFQIDSLSSNDISNVFFIEPLDYLPFVFLMDKSYAILTDSGGVQEEAPGLGKPVFVMRDNTERPEALIHGTVKLVGTDKSKLIQSITEILHNKEMYDEMSMKTNPYGQGNAAYLIIHQLINLDI